MTKMIVRLLISLSLLLGLAEASDERTGLVEGKVRGVQVHQTQGKVRGVQVHQTHLRQRDLQERKRGVNGNGKQMDRFDSGGAGNGYGNNNNNYNIDTNGGQNQGADRLFGNGITPFETKPCIPFEKITIAQKKNSESAGNCIDNNPSNFCCRAYWWLVDDNDDFPYLPCICNANTQNPTTIDVNPNGFENNPSLGAGSDANDADDGSDILLGAPALDTCVNGTVHNNNPLFSEKVKCQNSTQCTTAGHCCLAKFCHCEAYTETYKVSECVA